MNIVRAWKDPEYRATLSGTELADLPAHPCGPVELGDDALSRIAAGASTEQLQTLGCCGGWTQDSVCYSCGASCNGSCEGQSTCTVCTA
jgi:mersacidin/lichenicidin family type 2 lantibiotic